MAISVEGLVTCCLSLALFSFWCVPRTFERETSSVQGLGLKAEGQGLRDKGAGSRPNRNPQTPAGSCCDLCFLTRTMKRRSPA